MPQKTPFSRVLGLMSGTSLDGLDLALCEFNNEQGHFVFKILKASTVPYVAELKAALGQAQTLSAQDYFALHARYGAYVAKEVTSFLLGADIPDAIGSHGHTVFHQPQRGFSTQIGCGATVAAHTGITTVCDFRSVDVALGGQGAPLVPIGDALLFAQYDACLNIGGIANISFGKNEARKAFDICVANMLFNDLAGRVGQAYDAGGMLAAGGTVNLQLLTALNGLPYYQQEGARSLQREWYEAEVKPLFAAGNLQDLLATAVEHAAQQIAQCINQTACESVLVTGGGAYNHYLLQRIEAHTKAKLVVPDDTTIQFKEALIFAFLAHLRLTEHTNSLQSVTGASRNSVGGAVYLGAQKA